MMQSDLCPSLSTTFASPPIGGGYGGHVSDGVAGWLRWAGLGFDPFSPLDAAADRRIGEYLVGHGVFARVWGDKISWLFAPAGGGKTALRIAIAQACWVGQETNHPFPISYVPPFLLWGHGRPTWEEHLDTLTRAGAVTLFLAMACRPHWFFRLRPRDRQYVTAILYRELPGPLSTYLERLRETEGAALPSMTGPDLPLRDPPDAATLLHWCDELEKYAPDASLTSPAERWAALVFLLKEILGFPAIYILTDGLDGAPETIANPAGVADCLEPLLLVAWDWSGGKVYLKAFLPEESRPVLEERFPALLPLDSVSTLRWTPALLAEVVRRRVYVASGGSFGSLDAVASPALRDLETMLAKAIRPLPREMLIITRRVIEEHVRREGREGVLTPADVEAAIRWYQTSIRF